MKTITKWNVKGRGRRMECGGLLVTAESKARRISPAFWTLWSPNSIQSPRESVWALRKTPFPKVGGSEWANNMPPERLNPGTDVGISVKERVRVPVTKDRETKWGRVCGHECPHQLGTHVWKLRGVREHPSQPAVGLDSGTTHSSCQAPSLDGETSDSP